MKVYTPFDFWWQQNNNDLIYSIAIAEWKNTLSKEETDCWIKYFEAYKQAGSPEVPMSTVNRTKVNIIYISNLESEKKQPKRNVRILNT